jgi:prophage DNA circulation protein
MSWRDRLQPASFRGAPFYVDAITGTKARRVAVVKFAGRDGSEQQDLGRESDELDISAFVWGDDYDLQRDELEEALSTPGVAALSLPWRGDLYVRVTRGPITQESKDDGGYASIRFSVLVVDREVGSLRVRVDTSAQLKRASADTRARVVEDFAQKADVRGLPARYLERTQGVVRQMQSALARAQRITAGVVSPVRRAAETIDDIAQRSNAVLASPSAFAAATIDAIFSAVSLHDTVTGGVRRAAQVPLVVASAFSKGSEARALDRVLGAFRGLGEPFVTLGESALAVRADAAARAAARLARVGALAAVAEGYATATFDSATFAVVALERALAELDACQLLGPSDALFEALEQLRGALTEHVLETASRLPEIVRYKLPAPRPALVVAYDLYGDALMDADLIARNVVRDPLRVSGELEVLQP